MNWLSRSDRLSAAGIGSIGLSGYSGCRLGIGLLFDDNFGEILIYFVIDADDLLSDGDNFFKGLIEADRILIII